jgi:hypothetical protein
VIITLTPAPRHYDVEMSDLPEPELENANSPDDIRNFYPIPHGRFKDEEAYAQSHFIDSLPASVAARDKLLQAYHILSEEWYDVAMLRYVGNSTCMALDIPLRIRQRIFRAAKESVSQVEEPDG